MGIVLSLGLATTLNLYQYAFKPSWGQSKLYVMFGGLNLMVSGLMSGYCIHQLNKTYQRIPE